jgi:hypothetical protein
MVVAAPGRSFELPRPTGTVFRVRLLAQADGRTQEWREWVAPESGHCRRDGEQIDISTATIRVVVSPQSWGSLAGADVRSGSAEFVHGSAGHLCAGLAAVAHADRGVNGFDWRGLPVVAAVEEEITAQDASARGLFTLGSAKVRSYTVEHEPAATPRLPVTAYWLGPSLGDRRAVRAIEHYASYGASKPTEHVYTALYSRPADAAGVSVLPATRSPPLSELQVSSMSADAHLAKRTIAHFEQAHRRHGWPRFELRTASGERAVVYPNLGEGRPFTNFSVVVGSTLVGVAAGRGLTERDARKVASHLRPLA